MLLWKVASLLLLIVAAGAEKKIELQDIEEDNLKSEKEKNSDQIDQRQPTAVGAAPRLLSEEFLKSGLPLLRYLEGPTAPQPRYVHQYDVTEQPESRSSASAPSAPSGPAHQPQYGPPVAQQALVGYLSNIPMQIYLVPQHETGEQEAASPQSSQHVTSGTVSPQFTHYMPPDTNKVAYSTAPEAVQHTNYIEVPTAYARTFFPPPYTSPAYVTYAPQTNLVPAQPTVGPIIAYQIPVTQYSASSLPSMGYYKYYGKNNDIVDTEEVIESPKHYAMQTEAPYTKHNHYATQTEAPYTKHAHYATETEAPHTKHPEYPRYYNSRAPIREDHRHGAIAEIPPPNPLILKNPPPHLAHLPKALPISRPLTRFVYSGGNHVPSSYIPRPNEPYPSPIKRRPTSLLDSYIPSGVQVEYMKRGYTKDPPQAYEALSRVHQYLKQFGMPNKYDRGFLPNQMYHTAAGGITYGHYKRNAKDIARQKK